MDCHEIREKKKNTVAVDDHGRNWNGNPKDYSIKASIINGIILVVPYLSIWGESGSENQVSFYVRIDL